MDKWNYWLKKMKNSNSLRRPDDSHIFSSEYSMNSFILFEFEILFSIVCYLRVFQELFSKIPCKKSGYFRKISWIKIIDFFVWIRILIACFAVSQFSSSCSVLRRESETDIACMSFVGLLLLLKVVIFCSVLLICLLSCLGGFWITYNGC